MIAITDLPNYIISKPPKTNFFMKPFSPFLKHLPHTLFYNKLFSSDAVLLHEQDKKIKEEGYLFTARNNYFVPTDADTMVRAFEDGMKLLDKMELPLEEMSHLVQKQNFPRESYWTDMNSTPSTVKCASKD